VFRAEIHLSRSDRWITVATAKRPGTARYLAAKALTRAHEPGEPADRSRIVAVVGAPGPRGSVERVAATAPEASFGRAAALRPGGR
jgi:hypothetical protein